MCGICEEIRLDGSVASVEAVKAMTDALAPRGPDAAADWSVTLEYRGESTVSPCGVERPAGEPYRFGYRRFEPAQAWTVRFHLWSDSTHPVSRPEAFARLLDAAPHLELELPRLDLQWYWPRVEDLPRERWALRATSEIDLPPGPLHVAHHQR